MSDHRTNLYGDQRGAMMLLGIFMTTIVIGMLYYLAGVGETITYRERMQDAVDSGVFAGSLLYARAMNVIVLLNMATASVFAVAVAAYAAMFMLFSAAAAASAECNWANWSPCFIAACLSACAPQAACDAQEQRDIAIDVAENAHSAAGQIATATRIAAGLASAEIIMGRYRPPVQIGFGIGPEMPLDDEDPSRACSEILTFSGPQGITRGDSPWPLVSLMAYEFARPYASDCGGTRYLTQVMPTGIGATLLSCYIIRSDIAGYTKKIQDDVQMGGREFQFRGFAMAQDDAMPFEPNQERVDFVTWGKEDTSSLGEIVGFLEEVNRFSVAQSEYYFDGDDDREMWTWRMNWRSRLRRFRIGSGDAGVCPPWIADVCDRLSTLVIH